MTDEVIGGTSIVHGRGDIKKRDFIRALLPVEGSELDRVAGVSKVFEIHTLHDTTLVNIETGNDPDRQRHQILAAWIADTRIARAPRA